MKDHISLGSRRELVDNVRVKYQEASWLQKNKILDGFIAATGYQRKYAIHLLNKPNNAARPRKLVTRQQYYDQAVKSALISIWKVANQICAKRLQRLSLI